MKPAGLEVEFVKTSGKTLAVVTVSEKDVWPIESADIISVRPLARQLNFYLQPFACLSGIIQILSFFKDTVIVLPLLSFSFL